MREIISTVYVCRTPRCKRRNEEITSASIAAHTQGTGRRCSCSSCGQVMWFVRNNYKEVPTHG